MVSHARSCPRGILALSLFVLSLVLLLPGTDAQAKVQYKIETSLEGDPGDGVLSPRSLSGESASEVDEAPAPTTITVIVTEYRTAPFRWPFLFSMHPAAPAPLLWLDGRALPFGDLWEGRWSNASRSNH